MSDPIYWDDAYPIALLLRRTHPTANLLEVPLERLCEWVKQLDGFADEGDACPVDCLEQIQAEWVELKHVGRIQQRPSAQRAAE